MIADSVGAREQDQRDRFHNDSFDASGDYEHFSRPWASKLFSKVAPAMMAAKREGELCRFSVALVSYKLEFTAI
jgi:hypothetical protein